MRRTILIPFAIAVVGLLMAAGTIAAAANRPTPSAYVITWGGDTFLGDRAQKSLEEQGYGWALAKLPDLGASDLTVINVEAPLTPIYNLPPNPYYSDGSPTARYDVFTSRGLVRRYVLRSSPDAANAFATSGIDVATMSNNHALDQGPEGLADTINALQAAGITTIGAGLNARDATRPHIVDTAFGRVGIFAFGEEGGTAPEATADGAGISALNHENVEAARAVAKARGVDWMVAAVQWGNNYTDILPTQERWAARLAERGFDLVVGTGSHTAQALRIIDRTPVIFSLGNMSFTMEGRFTAQQPGFGLVVKTVLSGRGFRELRVTCIQTDNLIVQYQARPCSDEDAKRVLTQLAPTIVVEGATGTLTW